MTRPKARRMWAVYFQGKLYSLAVDKMQAGAIAWPENDIRRVRVSIQELRPRKKARRG